jgi:hypothetical protein
MVSFAALWLPIVLSAVLVFVVSSILHMAFTYHSRDYVRLPNEDAVLAAIRAAKPETRQYVFPYASGMKEMGSPEMQRKLADGPVGVLTIKPSGPIRMGPALGQWFVFSLVISALVAYAAAHALPAGESYLKVFRVVGTIAWLAYAGGQIPSAIWMGKPWSIAAKDLFDGLLYGLVTAGTFGWLWPR